MTSSWRSIVLQGQTVPYRIRRSPRSRRLGLRVGDEGLYVSLPSGAADRHAAPLIRQHEAWVLRQLEKIAGRQREAYAMRGACPLLLYMGEDCPLVRRAHLKRVSFEDGHIVLRQGLAAPEKVLQDWLRSQCRAALLPAIAAAEAALGKRHSRLTLRDQKTRWGSCTAKGALSFNWRLIMAPPFVLDYVACHEVMHMAVPNHSPAFWEGVTQLCPDTPKARQWLRRNQHRLMIDLGRLVSGLSQT